jgi:RecB family exonuclease
MAKADTGIRTRNLYDPASTKPFKLSRSKLERFLECPRCFYLDRRLGIDRPDGPPFNLNIAVDALLKREFDAYRQRGETHPLMKAANVDAVPFAHAELEKWRTNFTGVQYHHEPTNLIVSGAVDDLWVNPAGELMIVDYKATSTSEVITPAYSYRAGYRRQLEIYQWLFRQNGFRVSNVAYLVYANGRKDRDAFDGCLNFDLTVIPCEGSDSWVEQCLHDAVACLQSGTAPEAVKTCTYCLYRQAARSLEIPV